MIFTNSDAEFIKDNFDNYNELLNASHVNDVLDAIGDLIDNKGFAPPEYYDYNDFGRKAQRVYDSIYENN